MFLCYFDYSRSVLYDQPMEAEPSFLVMIQSLRTSYSSNPTLLDLENSTSSASQSARETLRLWLTLQSGSPVSSEALVCFEIVETSAIFCTDVCVGVAFLNSSALTCLLRTFAGFDTSCC
jgi:hypothetical protein